MRQSQKNPGKKMSALLSWKERANNIYKDEISHFEQKLTVMRNMMEHIDELIMNIYRRQFKRQNLLLTIYCESLLPNLLLQKLKIFFFWFYFFEKTF